MALALYHEPAANNRVYRVGQLVQVRLSGFLLPVRVVLAARAWLRFRRRALGPRQRQPRTARGRALADRRSDDRGPRPRFSTRIAAACLRASPRIRRWAAEPVRAMFHKAV